MTKLTAWIRDLIHWEPAIASWGGFGLLVSFLAHAFHWNPQQAAAAGAIAAAMATIVTAIHARPVRAAVITGAVTAITAALAAWNLHVPAAWAGVVATLIPVIMTVLGLTTSLRLTPLVRSREEARQQLSAGGSA